MTICVRCGVESPEGFRFCGGCGAPLEEALAPRQARKVVTALFCDVTGSTALGERLDPEVLRGVMNRYFTEIRAVIERHGGTVEKFIGDAVMAVFGIPRLHEDDALRAVRAASEIRRQLPALAEEVGVALQFRTGINTGPVLMGEGENLAIGDAVNVAARLEQAAAPGEIVLGFETLRLVRDAVQVEELEPLELKGKSGPVPAYQLIAVDPEAAGFARRFDVPLVGRKDELELLTAAWRRTVQESGCHLFTLLGAAGVGKSRLVAELLGWVGDRAAVLRGRCLHYGEGITFWPLVEALMPVGEPAQRVLEHLDTGGAATAQELFWEVRRLLESLAEQRPVILSIDDLQWAEPMLLDLLDHVADLSRGAPILLLCTARPELLEDRQGWGGGKLNATTVLLEPLGPQESEAMLDELGDGLDHDARERVIAASEGNPLFLEEMVALARERGTVEMPPTIQALLAARLELLAVEERELLERGSVEGEVFHRLSLKALTDERAAAEVELRLAGLVRKELIRPHPPTLAGDDAFRFRHLLIRDAAYDGLPKAVRAELHERFAEWLEEAGAGLVELDEVVGWHLEQAIRYQRELGREIDPELQRRTAEHLHAAGRRAGARNDVAAVRNLLERALTLAPEDDNLRPQIAVDLAEQLIGAGNFDRAYELISVAERDPATNALATLMRMDALSRTDPAAVLELTTSRLPELLEQLAAAGDERGLAKAHRIAFNRHWLASQATPAAEEIRLAAEHARRAGYEGLRSQALASYVATLILGPCDTPTLTAELDAIEREESGPTIEAAVAWGRSTVARHEARFDEARRLIRHAIELLTAVGSLLAYVYAQWVATVEMAAGDPAAARAALERSDASLAKMGERGYRSTTLAMLAEACEALGDRDAAVAAIELSDQLSAPEDVINYAITHRLRARLALADGDAEKAERWARSAVENALRSDHPTRQAAAKLELARVLSAVGRRAEAEAEGREALAIHEAKGDGPGIAQARALLDEIAGANV